MDQIRCGSNFQSQNESTAHFGLGAETVSRVDVTWPGGAESAVLGPGTEREILVESGEISRGGFESGDVAGWLAAP